VGAAQADNPHRRTGFGEDQSTHEGGSQYNRKNCRLSLTFAFCSPMMTVCTNGCHAQFVFHSCPRAAPTHAGVVAGIGLEWNSVPSPKFVQPGCTVTQHHA
jgi:hypothetical protein